MGNNCCTCVNRKDTGTKKPDINYATQTLGGQPGLAMSAGSAKFVPGFNVKYNTEQM